MKKVLRYITVCWMMVSILVFSVSPAEALATNIDLIPRIEVLTPGVYRTFDIALRPDSPFEFNQFLILTLGYGTLSITLTKTDTVGDFIMLTGLGISSAGILPVFKFGITKVQLQESIDLGTEAFPYGVLWMAIWVNSTETEEVPPYLLDYKLTLDF